MESVVVRGPSQASVGFSKPTLTTLEHRIQERLTGVVKPVVWPPGRPKPSRVLQKRADPQTCQSLCPDQDLKANCKWQAGGPVGWIGSSFPKLQSRFAATRYAEVGAMRSNSNPCPVVFHRERWVGENQVVDKRVFVLAILAEIHLEPLAMRRPERGQRLGPQQ